MKTIKLLISLVVACAFAPNQASAVPLLGPDLASFSVLAGGYATYGAGAEISGTVGAATYVTADGTSAGNVTATPAVSNALVQLAQAQSALTNMTTTDYLGATMAGNITLAPGVYSSTALTMAANTILTLDGGNAASPIWVFNIPTYLVTGDAAKIIIANAGAGATVMWNTGYYTALGANTSFIGTILANQYISEGAGTNMVCGSTFAASYISIPANVKARSSNCEGSGTWAGSVNGMGAGLDIVNGVAVAAAVVTAPTDGTVPEPKTIALMLTGLGAMAFMTRRRKSAKAIALPAMA